MLKQILFFTAIFFSFYARAQQIEKSKPEYNIYRDHIFDNASPFFYPTLFDRYMQGDTSLTLEDFRHLYFGYTFQSKYVPYQESKQQSKMLNYLRKGSLSTIELDEFIKIAELNLLDLPFDIRTLHILTYSYKQKNDSINQAISEFKEKMIIKAILSTGNGRTEQTAYHVIDRAHEYDIVNELGLRFATTSDLSNPMCDYLIVQPNDQNIRGIYFDVSRLLQVKAGRQN